MHCLQIVALPAPVNFLPNAMALAQNHMSPQEATLCLSLPLLAVWTEALGLRVIEVPTEKFFERFDYQSLAEVV